MCQTHITADVEDQRRGRGGQRPELALDDLDAPGDRAQQHLGQPEDAEDRRDVEQQEVLDHVHDQQVVGQRVDGGDQRGEDA